MFVFDVGGEAWRYYDWTKVTTIAAFGQYEAELMCFAHSKGVRLVLKGNIGTCTCLTVNRCLLQCHQYCKIKRQTLHVAQNTKLDIRLELDVSQRV